jgi:hypothetical protein
MAWRVPTDAEVAALIGRRIDVERTGVDIIWARSTTAARRKVVA